MPWPLLRTGLLTILLCNLFVIIFIDLRASRRLLKHMLPVEDTIFTAGSRLLGLPNFDRAICARLSPSLDIRVDLGLLLQFCLIGICAR